MQNTVISVTTSYAGASAQHMQGFITTPLEKSIASADGIDYMTSESEQGTSTIKAFIKLGYEPEKAFTNIMSKVAEVRNQIPHASDAPVVAKSTGSQFALMYVAFNDKNMTPQQITDYITRVVQPKLETIEGVAQAQVLGGNTFAMRIWLNPEKMAALSITPGEIRQALLANNYQSAAGTIKGELVAYDVNADTDLHTPQQFKQLVVKDDNGTLIRLRDVAKVELGSQDYDSSVYFNGKKAIFLGITATPSANPLTVIARVRKEFPVLAANYPPSFNSKIVYDATRYIRSSIHEVIRTIIEASIIVMIVIFLFLGSVRAVLIPAITIPLSLIGVCSFMLALGYSLNLLTLLAMVLAIGMVVDDAIVVVENIHRHIEAGLTRFNAALQGMREIAMPIVTMTITLAAVYAPIGFMGGMTGALFKEFAFTLASAVILSGFIAVTLSPMMCSKILPSRAKAGRFSHFLDRGFERFQGAYQRRLHAALNYRTLVVIFIAVVLTSCFFLYVFTQKELAPHEDQSALFVVSTAPQYANIDYVEKYTHQFDKVFTSFPALQDYFVVNGAGSVNSVFGGMILKPWDERKQSDAQIAAALNRKLSQVAGLQTIAFQVPPLPVGGGGLGINFVITGTASYKTIYQAAQRLVKAAYASGLFVFVQNKLKFNKPELQVHINRSKAADLGINMQQIGNALATVLGGGDINRFSIAGRSYEVIPQLIRDYRLNPDQIEYVYLRTASGQLVPLSTVVSVSQTVQPNSLKQFQQLNSASIEAMMRPGKTIGDGLRFMQQQAKKILPRGLSYNYAGQSRQFIQEGSALMYTFMFAVLIIFLVLAAQFESFRDPFVILIAVPLSIWGALIPLNLGLATINIYTQVGLITLIGLISKHGILMVEFANKLQINENLSIRAAIEKAASIRLRPILMTTASMVLGVSPLIMATGAGAVSRFDMGIVIASGMLVGTCFTLFVVPTMYTFWARDHRVKNNVITGHTEAL